VFSILGVAAHHVPPGFLLYPGPIRTVAQQGGGSIPDPSSIGWEERTPPASARLAAFGQAVLRALVAERLRWALWLPVALGTGISLYFALRAEPPPWAGAVALAVAVAGGVAARRRPALVVLAVALGALALGFATAQFRAARVAAPVIEKRWGPAGLEGRVVSAEVLPNARRAVLDQVVIAGIPAERTPARVRVRIAGAGEGRMLVPGDRVKARAVLLPPPAPSAPGGFDFQRLAWFQRLGAVGFTLGAPEVLPSEGRRAGFALRLAGLRQRIDERVRAAVEGPAGAVAAALMTGRRGAIPPDVIDAMRDSGLAHLLAISGLHIGLLAGLIFFGVRAALALVPGLALRYPVKKWAAAAALAGAFAYLLISGATVPTQRAYLMIGLVLLAVLLDRTAMSMRLVGWAAAAILLLAPESLLGASFQLSFAAVVALIAGYETMGWPLARWGRQEGGGWWRRPVVYLAGVAMTTLIAGSATGIFAIYHFNRFAIYGLAGNLMAVPLMALWIMPWGLVAFLLMPFGLESLALAPMGLGVEAMLSVARTVAGWQGSVALIPAMPTGALVLAVFGGLWLCLWRGRWRLIGTAGIAAALLTIPFVRPPGVLITGDARLIAVRTADGGYMLSSKRAGRFAAGRWLRRAGERQGLDWPREGASADGRLTCDAAGCLYRAHGRVVALVSDERALAEDCAVADVVISTEPVRAGCRRPEIVVDRFDLWREGGHALWLGPDRLRVESVNGARGDRPWVQRPEREGR